MIIKYLIVRDGREYIMDAVPDWADSEEYQITKLSSEAVVGSTDDTTERLKILEEIYELEEKEIALLKQRLEAFVEVVEGIAELTEVVSHSSVECRSKLIIIGDSCKKILAPQE